MTEVYLYSYSRWWKWLFLKEKLLLTLACGRSIDIQHVGSTAIPGMVAKPIIDIIVGVQSFDQAVTLIEPIKRLGYAYMGENSELRQHYYVKGEPVAYHLYVMELQSEERISKIVFRDYLRVHPDTANSYTELKMNLAQQFTTDLRAYQDGKKDFVDQVVR